MEAIGFSNNSEKENYGELSSKTHQVSHINPVCDDIVTIDLEIRDGKVLVKLKESDAALIKKVLIVI